MPHDITTWLFFAAAVSFAVPFLKDLIYTRGINWIALGLCLQAVALLLFGK